MQILLYSWPAYNMFDLEHALRKKGFVVDTFTYDFENFEEDADFCAALSHALQDTTYDFVMSINYFPLISDVCTENKIKYISWTCDSPMLTLYTTSVFNPYNYIFVFDQWVYLDFKSRGVKNIYYLPLAVDTDRLDSIEISDYDRTKYSNDISFVGSLYEKNFYDKLTNIPEYLQGYLEGVMYSQMQVYGKNFLETMVTDEVEEYFEKNVTQISGNKFFGGLPLLIATTYLGFKTTALERTFLLNRLSKNFSVTLYTKSDTDALPLVKNKGPIHYLTEMPKVFRLSKININITVRTIKTGLSLRIFDVLGAGGFLLTNYQPELELYFENKKDLVFFTSPEDMMVKVKYYLSHDEERMAIAGHGYETVKKMHNYDNRLNEIFQLIEAANNPEPL